MNKAEIQRVDEALDLVRQKGREATMPDGTPAMDVIGPLTQSDLAELAAYRRAEAARLNAEADQLEAR